MRNKTFLNRQIASVISILYALVLFNAGAYAQQAAEGNSHVLKPTPKTVAWGYYAATTPPVLRIKSGDTVEVYSSSPRSGRQHKAQGGASAEPWDLAPTSPLARETGGSPHAIARFAG
jgi:hypothetical protein